MPFMHHYYYIDYYMLLFLLLSVVVHIYHIYTLYSVEMRSNLPNMVSLIHTGFFHRSFVSFFLFLSFAGNNFGSSFTPFGHKIRMCMIWLYFYLFVFFPLEKCAVGKKNRIDRIYWSWIIAKSSDSNSIWRKCFFFAFDANDAMIDCCGNQNGPQAMQYMSIL